MMVLPYYYIGMHKTTRKALKKASASTGNEKMTVKPCLFSRPGPLFEHGLLFAEVRYSHPSIANQC